MAHGFSSVDKTPEPGLNLGAMVAGKIKDSFGMAAEERKARDEEIAKLEAKNKEDRTDEESQRLAELVEQKKTRTTGGKKDRIKNSFFTKAMMSQFGGDRARRMQGTFSKNPKPSQDPSLTKEQRFSALLDEGMGAPADAPDTPDDYDDSMNSGAPEGAAPPQQSGLDKALSKVSEALAIISTKVSALKSEEAKSTSTTESRLSKFNGVFESIKNYFDRDNDLKETENSIEQQKIDNLKDAQADAKADRKEDSMDDTIDGSDQETVDKLDDEDGGGIMKGIKGLFKNFMGKKKGGKGGGKTQFSSPIGPQPMNSKTPWAAKGAGENGGMFGQGGFAPRLPATKLSEGGVVPRKKLSAGGVYDNPTTTTLNPGDAVVPLNRNNPIADSFKESGKEKSEESGDPSIASSMADIMQLPTKVAGGLVLTKMSQVFSGVAGFLKPVISPIMNAIAPAFGLPATIISGLFGGAAQAATSKINMDAFTGKKDSKMRGKKGSPAPSIPPTGGANLGSTMKAGETIQAQSNTGPGGFVQGGSGLSSEGGTGSSGGYATHYHLSPPSNDEAGFAQSRAVALQSAQMMLSRGSSIYFGNIKENANPATLVDQIAREQIAHTRPGRTQGGIDMQETGSDGSRNMKFPLKVTNVNQDTSGASGRTARIIGTNVTLAHGGVGSANSIETATAPQTPDQPVVAAPGSSSSAERAIAPPGAPSTQVSPQAAGNGSGTSIVALPIPTTPPPSAAQQEADYYTPVFPVKNPSMDNMYTEGGF
tara:strand:- start:1786 stop:4077 length:2292 start_codon:yes stop_codon:yes gene_type:complete